MAAHALTPDDGTDTRYAWRRPGVLWLLSLILVPLVLALALTFLRGDHLEDVLTADADQALASAGITGVQVTAYSRDLTVNPQPNVRLTRAQLENAVAVVADVEGVRRASYGTDDSGSSGAGATALAVDVWLLLAGGYLLGSALLWVVLAAALPSERRLEAETGLETEAVL